MKIKLFEEHINETFKESTNFENVEYNVKQFWKDQYLVNSEYKINDDLSVDIPTGSVNIEHSAKLIKLPFKCEEIKKSINYIQKNIKKSDKIYVYYGSENAFKYYNDIHYIKPSVPIIKGTEHRNNNDAYISELKNLEGRNWLLFSHIYYNEEAFIIEKLDSIGYNKIETFNAFGSSAYLYDFKKLKLTEDLK